MADGVSPTPEERVREAVAAYNRGDLRALLAGFHDDIELVPSPQYERPGTVYRGKDGVRTIVGDTVGSFGVRAELLELRDLGESVLARIAVKADGPLAGPVVSREVAWIFTFGDDGLIRRAHGHMSEAEALEAADRPTPEEFRAAFEGAPVAIVLVDDDGCFRDVNHAASRFLGRPSEDLRHRQIADFVPAARGAGFRAFWHRLMDGEAQEPQFALIDARGEPQDVALNGKANYMPGYHLISFSVAGSADPEPAARSSLTPREREIFQLLALGFSGREIADRLVLSPDTVRTHVQNGIGRLGAKTRAQGIAIALTRGDISL